MLQVNNLIKKYGRKTILKIEKLHIERGIVHLKGINGSGKSTFSKIVAGILPFQGELILNQKFSATGNAVEYRKLVNYGVPEPSYPEFLTAFDLITFVGKAKGAPKSSFLTIANKFGITEYMYDHICTYSSGMIKRLSLCLAFLGNPELILLDEPFNTLDKEVIENLINMIKDYHKKGVNFILVSHQGINSLGIPISASFTVDNLTIGQD